ncbi:MAG TPA: DUF4062 domain-containing protein [Streptosporangiaceae bacterium]
MSEGSAGGAVIRTPDQRLRVFVSSTLEELVAERRAVSRAIAALRLTPVMFELGARPHPPRELYRAYLAQSDVFVGLYWQRYGWIAPGMQISGLEDEFELARGMPQLLYVKAPAPDCEPRLADLLDRIARQVSYAGLPRPRSWVGWSATIWRCCSASGSPPARRSGPHRAGSVGRGRCRRAPRRWWGGSRPSAGRRW